MFYPVHFHGVCCTVHQTIGNRRLIRSGKIADLLISRPGAAPDKLVNRSYQSRLQAGKAEITPRFANQRTGQGITLRISGPGSFFQLRPARNPEAQKLGALVKGLAYGVIDGGAEAGVLFNPFNT